jgi:predicted GIY-YIG superfamily endonuclease
MSSLKYRVYVIELSSQIFSEHSRFRAMNPQFNGVLDCLYVGMTSKTPEERFQQHMTGYKNRKGVRISSGIVRKYGKFLRPSLYSHIDPMTKSAALKMERELALKLRRQRYAVWYN